MKAITYDLVKDAKSQSFTTNLNGHTFEFSFTMFRDLLFADVMIDGAMVQAGVRCVPNKSIFGGTVNSAAGGVFGFDCIGEEYPNPSLFDGHTCRFVFVPYSELNK